MWAFEQFCDDDIHITVILTSLADRGCVDANTIIISAAVKTSIRLIGVREAEEM